MLKVRTWKECKRGKGEKGLKRGWVAEALEIGRKKMRNREEMEEGRRWRAGECRNRKSRKGGK